MSASPVIPLSLDEPHLVALNQINAFRLFGFQWKPAPPHCPRQSQSAKARWCLLNDASKGTARTWFDLVVIVAVALMPGRRPLRTSSGMSFSSMLP